jgi:hypothetical protein
MSDIPGFPARLADACGTDKAARIAELLDMRYQTVNNYLKGRVPTADVLVTISDRTLCSIDWLLTGRGKKFRDDAEPEGATIPSRQLEAIARRVIVEVINEMSASPQDGSPEDRSITVQRVNVGQGED